MILTVWVQLLFPLRIFYLGDMAFAQTGARTSSTAGLIEVAGTSDGFSSHPHLSRGDPISIVYSLQNHA